MEHERPGTLSALVVADEQPETSQLVSRALRAAGFDVLIAPDGQSALAWCDESPPAVLLVGPDAFDRSQLSELEAMRARRHGVGPRVIVLSNDPEREVSLLTEGADDRMSDPLDVADLVARVYAQVEDQCASARAHAHDEIASRRIDALSLLRKVRPSHDIEAVAGDVCERLVAVPHIEAAGVVAFRGRRTAVSVAGAGAWESWRVPGETLAPGIARVLIDAVADGPRVNLASNRVVHDLHVAGMREATGELDVALVPIRGTSGTLGVLAIGASPTSDVAAGGAILASAIDVAAVLRALVAPDLEHRAEVEDARLAILDVIRERAFTPVYQPIVDMLSGEVVGYEGLTRWRDGVAPDVRFGEAHDLGVGVELECAAIMRILAEAPPRSPGVSLSFNASPATVLSGALGRLLAEAPADIVLELTEHEKIEDYAALRAELDRMDVTVAVDDAGGGYASMRHVLDLQPAIVKLDTNWVREIHHDVARQSLTAAMADFAGKMGIHVVAEGVETAEERRALIELGVTTGQGHLFGAAARGADIGAG